MADDTHNQQLDAAEFHTLVYHVVRLIPYGRVTSYGHIAKLIGMPRHSRFVGQALKVLGDETDVPWQRVVSSTGAISSRGPGTEGARRQREALVGEGVDVILEMGNEELGGGRVKWGDVGWFPEPGSVDLDGA